MGNDTSYRTPLMSRSEIALWYLAKNHSLAWGNPKIWHDGGDHLGCIPRNHKAVNVGQGARGVWSSSGGVRLAFRPKNYVVWEGPIPYEKRLDYTFREARAICQW